MQNDTIIAYTLILFSLDTALFIPVSFLYYLMICKKLVDVVVFLVYLILGIAGSFVFYYVLSNYFLGFPEESIKFLTGRICFFILNLCISFQLCIERMCQRMKISQSNDQSIVYINDLRNEV